MAVTRHFFPEYFTALLKQIREHRLDPFGVADDPEIVRELRRSSMRSFASGAWSASAIDVASCTFTGPSETESGCVPMLLASCRRLTMPISCPVDWRISSAYWSSLACSSFWPCRPISVTYPGWR